MYLLTEDYSEISDYACSDDNLDIKGEDLIDAIDVQDMRTVDTHIGSIIQLSSSSIRD